jgi:hypothetical protein
MLRLTSRGIIVERLRPGEGEREQHADDEREQITAEDLGRRHGDVGPPVVVAGEQRLAGVDRRRHDELRHVAELDEQVPDDEQRKVRSHRHQRSCPAIVERGHR